MSRVLSDAELKELFGLKYEPPFIYHRIYYAVAEAQDAKTAGEVCREMAEWLLQDDCGHPHRLPMYQCHSRLTEAIKELRAGRVPGG